MDSAPISMIKKNQDGYDKLFFHKQTMTEKEKSSPLQTSETSVEGQQHPHHNIKVSIYYSDEKESESVDIKLTESEVQLFKELMHVIRDSGCGTTLRIAGGWVRDKLRGDDSNDIDITLDNMMGEAFAELVNKHLASKHHQTHRIGVIQSNPEQSKHLETATVKVFDMWIDFVNLRSETYTDTSRIPEISIGTPIQDALRRDLTINSLFFNINENRIEDFTGNGIKDLKDGIIRTPLPSLTTFLDDPLRVFRSIRFASRLGFKIDEELFMAGSNSIVKDAIKSKISHERIAKEFDGMLSGKRPSSSVGLINDFGLFDCLFSLPTSGLDELYIDQLKFSHQDSEIYCTIANHWIEVGNGFEEIDTKRQVILSALMLPFHGIQFKNANKKNKEMSIIHYMFIEYIKFSNKDYDDVSLILECSEQLTKHIINFNATGEFNRKEIGLIIHRSAQLWLSVIITSFVQRREMPSKENIKKFFGFVEAIKDRDLIGVWNIKRLLNGKQVQDLLKRKPGTWLAPIVQLILEWQLENPTKTEQECKDWLLTLDIK
ncbi:hypothetical protein RB653_003515 [Dictyostelium firmibasis]|uniref:Poly A polymerase head domain-containing protein n=1 Tax=Dictyostelium firmibasis TaxID=79012 RepID=A0AAN7TXU6_9MYCE